MIQAQENDTKNTSLTKEQIIENLPSINNGSAYFSNGCNEYFSNLVNLNLSKRKMDHLPVSLSLLKKLEYLNLDNNRFCTLRNEVYELSNLKELWMRNNKIKALPKELGNLSNLKVFHLSRNQITDLQNSHAKLNKLEICCLEHNRFKTIPICIAIEMKNLTFLIFSCNVCSEQNIYPKTLLLKKTFPKWILSSKYKKFETVSLNKTTFQKYDLPQRTFTTYVKKLSMNQWYLEIMIVKCIISKMTNLECLMIGNDQSYLQNNFCDLPIPTKKKPSSPRKIDGNNTGIFAVRKTINRLINLCDLNISFSCISSLPEEICSLHNLSTLIMNNNYLCSLPNDIGEIISLRYLKLRHNSLTELPEGTKYLRKLEYIDLYVNKFDAIPDMILNLSNLVGLNLEENYFSVACLKYFSGFDYKAMRENLRSLWPDVSFDYRSLCGKKSESHTDGKNVPSGSLCNSISEDKSTLNTLQHDTYKSLSSEHWDTSDDSAEEFDPYEYKKPKKKYYPPFTFYKPFQRVYYPSDLHKAPVRAQVMQMLNEGILTWSEDYEEGQFDDP